MQVLLILTRKMARLLPSRLIKMHAFQETPRHAARFKHKHSSEKALYSRPIELNGQ